MNIKNRLFMNRPNWKKNRITVALTSTLLVVTVSSVSGANIIKPAGGDGVRSPYYFIEVTEPSITNGDSVTLGSSSGGYNTDLLDSSDVMPNGGNQVLGIESKGINFLNKGAVKLYIGKTKAVFEDVTVSVTGIKSDIPLNNDGAIAVGSKSAQSSSDIYGTNATVESYGIDSDVETNNGNLDVKAQGGSVTLVKGGVLPEDMDSSAVAYGIKGALGLNNGSIVVNAIGGRNYLVAFDDSTGETSFGANSTSYGVYGDVGVNNGSITVIGSGGHTGNDYSYSSTGKTINSSAITIGKGIKGNVDINKGPIRVEMRGGSSISVDGGDKKIFDTGASALAIGIEGEVKTNSGSIDVWASGGYVAAKSHGVLPGMLILQNEAIGIFGNVEINNGDINVVAESGEITLENRTVDALSSHVFLNTKAVGISVSKDDTLVTNNAAIRVKAFDGRVRLIGETAKGIYYRHVISYGIEFLGSNNILHSSGLIFAGAASSDELTVKKSYQVVSSSPLSITGYAMKFNNQEQVDADYSGQISVASGVNSVFKHAMLYVYTDNSFDNATSYTIPTLVEGADISDQFSRVQLGVTSPDYRVSLVNGGGSQLQKLAIAYGPEISTSLMTMQVSQKMMSSSRSIVSSTLRGAVFNAMQRSNPLYAEYEGVRLASTEPILNSSDITFDVMPEKSGWAFAMPYYSNLKDNSSPMGYDADIYGFSGGYNHWMNSDLILGFHAGYGRGSLDFIGAGYDKKAEDIDAGAFGLQGLYRLGENWLLDGVSSFFYTSNDYKDSNPLNRESGDYNTYGIDTSINLNYVYMVNQQHRIIPSLGLRHLWQHVESFTVTNLDNADVHYGDVDEHQLYANLGVDWFGDFFTDNKWKIVPSLGVGVEQALTNNEFSNIMAVGSASSKVTNKMDKTALTTSASVEFTKDTIAFNVGYSGSYSSDVAENSVYLQMKYFF